MPQSPIIYWFRNDLRLADNSGLSAAAATGRPVVPVYIFDEAAPARWAPGAATRWWLHKSLETFDQSLRKSGLRLVLRRGATRDHLLEIAKISGATAIYCSRAYEPWASALEAELKVGLAQDGLELKRFAGDLLREPEDLKTGSGAPFKVYTPFWRALRAAGVSPKLQVPPENLTAFKRNIPSDDLAQWQLLPDKPDWAHGLRTSWSPGEAGAQARLAEFLKSAVGGYAEDRNRPDLEATSRLSPHLHFGEISPARCWSAAVAAAAHTPKTDKGCETFLKELAWREFSHHLLHHWPDLADQPWRKEFQKFPWRADRESLAAWQKGRTGYPIVDAGMRELWHTGWMHNRVRMIVASFLVKDLMIPWQDGAAWFWDTLVDADLANNAAGWQWVAGCGADAAPYFRIFNPVKQGETFDPGGNYVRRYVPELRRLPDDYIHAPWTAPADTLARAGIVLDQTYPLPMVDHARARDFALDAFKSVRTAT